MIHESFHPVKNRFSESQNFPDS